MNSHTDIELIQRTLNGETDAFGELIKRYQDAVYATALHRIGNFADAQDVAQEAFIEAYKSLHKLREHAKFPGWLHRITLHQCNRLLRSHRENEPIEELGDAQILEISNGKTVLPDEALERKELQQMVLKAIASLPQKVGEVVTMYYIDGFSYNEIANFLSIPKTTIKGRLQMGRKQMKEEFITMVEETLKQNRPDERFSEKVLAEIIEQTKAARKRDAHDEVMQLCEKALEVLEHLDMTEEHKRTQVDVLNWQSDEWLKWFGKPENALENFQRAERISAELKDDESKAKWLMMQAIALSRMEKYQEMIEPVQKARILYGELGETKSQVVCDAIFDLINLLPEGWQRLDNQHELNTGYGIHRYSLIYSAEGLTYVDENLRDWKAWCEVMVPHYMRRGWEFRDRTVLARAGRLSQILKFPTEVGRSWHGAIEETRYGEILPTTRTIEANDDTVVIPAGRFENCLRVVTIIGEPTNADYSDTQRIHDRLILCGKTTMWFAPGVGLVKYRHDDEWGSSHSAYLIEYQVNERARADYYPVSIGNRWKYQRYIDWCRIRVTEGYRIVAESAETIHIACAMYSDLLDDAEQLGYFQAWLEDEKASADIRGEARTLCRLGNVYARLGEWDAMLNAYQQMGERIKEIETPKLEIDLWIWALDGNLNTPWASPLAFVMGHAERALQIAEEIGDRERQRRGLDVMTRFCILHDKFAEALKFAQQAYPIALAFNNIAEQMFLEAQMDMIKAWLADSEEGQPFDGGTYTAYSMKTSKSEIAYSKGFGGYIHKIAFHRRPYPSISNVLFWSDAPLLKLPATKGESWLKELHDGKANRLIEATDETVSAPAGTFEGCVRVKTTVKLRAANEGSPQADEIYNRSKGFREGEKWMWFAPGVGIVRAEHHHQNGKRTVIELTDYQIEEDGNSYLPLALGNRWNYEWRDENGELLFKEQDRVILEHEEQFYIACSGYTTNVAEYGK